MTGLSGAGKTTLAHAVAERLRGDGRAASVLDGDELRATVSRDLGFSKADRDEHVQRVARLAVETAARGEVVVVALVSPYREARERARATVTPRFPFVEVYVACPLDVLRSRDPKGLYRRADAGEITNFTGISDPYEVPLNPDLVVDTSKVPIDAAVELVIEQIQRIDSQSGQRSLTDGPT